jgi:hypothetical protein
MCVTCVLAGTCSDKRNNTAGYDFGPTYTSEHCG